MKGLVPWKRTNHAAAPVKSDERWFDRLWEDPFEMFSTALRTPLGSRMPAVDVTENKKEVTVRAELPGMNEKDIDVSCREGVLRIRGEKQDEKEEKNKNRWYRECSYGSFSRDVPVGNGVECDKAKARYKHGVLTVKLPKKQHAQKAIDINVA